MDLDISHIIVAILAFVAAGAFFKRKPRDTYQDEPLRSQSSSLKTFQGSALEPDQKDKEMSGFEQLFTIVFMGGWLIAWTAGIGMAFQAFASGGGPSMFLLGWLIAAIAGWFFGVYALGMAIMGKRVTRGRHR